MKSKRRNKKHKKEIKKRINSKGLVPHRINEIYYPSKNNMYSDELK